MGFSLPGNHVECHRNGVLLCGLWALALGLGLRPWALALRPSALASGVAPWALALGLGPYPTKLCIHISCFHISRASIGSMERFEIDLADVAAALASYRKHVRDETRAIEAELDRSQEAWRSRRNWMLGERNGGRFDHRVTTHPLYRRRGWKRRGYMSQIPEWKDVQYRVEDFSRLGRLQGSPRSSRVDWSPRRSSQRHRGGSKRFTQCRVGGFAPYALGFASWALRLTLR